MAYVTRGEGIMSILSVPEVPIFRSAGIISAEDFNAIPDESGDTILWGEGDTAFTKADGIDFLRALNEEYGRDREDTKMDKGTWMAEILYNKETQI